MSLHPVFPVRSARLLLRPLRAEDAPALSAYRSLDEVCRWVPFEPMDAVTVAARLRGPWARVALEAEGQGLFLGVELAATGELIGDVMLHWVSDEHRTGEIGYIMAPWQAGHGYATEATHTLLHLAFDELALHRVIARVDARNAPSARVAGRLGMRQEAHLIQNEWVKGGWSDELDFALLEHEWQAQHTPACPTHT